MRITVGVVIVTCLFIIGYYFFLRNSEIIPENSACCGNSVVSKSIKGKKVFVKNCASCHGINAGGTGIAPKLRGRNLTKNFIRTVVSKGKGKMRAFPYISSKELESLSDFVSFLK